MFHYDHPLVNLGAGRFKSDPINDQNIERALNNYRSQNKEKFDALEADLPINEKTVRLSKYLFPCISTVVGLIGSLTFTRKDSHYIGKIFVGLMLYGGFQLSAFYSRSYNAHRYFTLYPQYPLEIQKMIDNNDARYAHKWLQQGNNQPNP